MEPLSQRNGTAAHGWGGHPALLAVCLFGLAVVTATWWTGVLSTSTAQASGVPYVACLYGYLMIHFGVDDFIRQVKLVWFCLTALRGLFDR